jgi:ArsR family transcriptional regulator
MQLFEVYSIHIPAYVNIRVEGEIMKKIIKSMGLLSDETRLRILNVLAGGESCVCEVMQALGISQSAASRGLTSLCDAGFLKVRRDGPWSLYSIDTEGMPQFQKELVEMLARSLEENDMVAGDRQKIAEARRSSPRSSAVAAE